MDVIGKDGEIINMSFSRYNQMFLGLITDSSRKVSESALYNAMGEVKYAGTENIEEKTVTRMTDTVE